MLKITTDSVLVHDESTNKICELPAKTIKLEHSLLSLSKWESKWKRPFLSSEKSLNDIQEYIKCMALDSVDDIYFSALSDKNIDAVTKYIEDPMTATTFSNLDTPKKGKQQVFTSELIYYYMFAFGIPKECERWHLNRLMTLIQIFSVKNSDPKKKSKHDIYARNRALNEAARRKYHTKG